MAICEHYAVYIQRKYLTLVKELSQTYFNRSTRENTIKDIDSIKLYLYMICKRFLISYSERLNCAPM